MVHKHQKFIVELLSIGSFDWEGSYELTGTELCHLQTVIALNVSENVLEICLLFGEKQSLNCRNSCVNDKVKIRFSCKCQLLYSFKKKTKIAMHQDNMDMVLKQYTCRDLRILSELKYKGRIWKRKTSNFKMKESRSGIRLPQTVLIQDRCTRKHHFE